MIVGDYTNGHEVEFSVFPYDFKWKHAKVTTPYNLSLQSSTFHSFSVYVILGQQFEHVGLLSSLQSRGLLDRGDYFVVGVDLEQYDPKTPDRYLRGLLQNDQEPHMVDAFRAYLAVVPSAPIGFDAFATKVGNLITIATSTFGAFITCFCWFGIFNSVILDDRFFCESSIINRSLVYGTTQQKS